MNGTIVWWKFARWLCRINRFGAELEVPTNAAVCFGHREVGGVTMYV